MSSQAVQSADVHNQYKWVNRSVISISLTALTACTIVLIVGHLGIKGKTKLSNARARHLFQVGKEAVIVTALSFCINLNFLCCFGTFGESAQDRWPAIWFKILVIAALACMF